MGATRYAKVRFEGKQVKQYRSCDQGKLAKTSFVSDSFRRVEVSRGRAEKQQQQQAVSNCNQHTNRIQK